MADEKPKERSEEELAIAADFKEISGKDATDADIAHYAEYDDRRALMAQDFGKDATKYGATAVEESAVSEELRPYYDAWREHNPDSKLNNVVVEQLGWQKDAKKVETYRAELDGTIRKQTLVGEDGKRQEFTIIDKAAADKLGRDFGYSGSSAGKYFLIEDGADIDLGKSSNFSQINDGKSGVYSQVTGDGKAYRMYGSTGNPKDFSIVGDVFGQDVAKKIGDMTPNEFKGVMDFVPGTSTIGRVTIGNEWSNDAFKFQTDTLGLKPKEIQTLKAVGEVALAVGTFGASVPLQVAAGAADLARNRAAGISDWETTLRGAGMLAVSYAIGGGTVGVPAGVERAVAGMSTLERAAASTFASRAIAGNSWEDSLKAGAISYGAARLGPNGQLAAAAYYGSQQDWASALQYAAGYKSAADGKPTFKPGGIRNPFKGTKKPAGLNTPGERYQRPDYKPHPWESGQPLYAGMTKEI